MFELKTGLLIVHLVGLAIGLGAATLLDLLIIRYFTRDRIAPEHYRMVDFASKLVTIGLVLLWLSGLGFFYHYYVTDPVALTNQKIWAKVTIVSLLTLNGFYVHRAVLPVIRENVGYPLFYGVSWGRQLAMLTAGAVSATSWYVPLAIGAMRELNFTVSAMDILAAYGAILLLAVFLAITIGSFVTSRGREASVGDSLVLGNDLALAAAGRVDHAPIEFMTEPLIYDSRPIKEHPFTLQIGEPAPIAPPSDTRVRVETNQTLQRDPLSR